MGFGHKLKVYYFLITGSNVLFLPAVNFAKIHTKCGQGKEKELRVWEEIKWFLLLHFTTDIPEQTLMSSVHFSPGFPLPLSLSIFQFTSVTQLVLLQRVVEKKFCFLSVGSDTPQGFHQSLYSCLCALQDEEWELFQCTLDNTK